MPENINANVSIGQTVSINPRNDRSREKRVTGVVVEVLTKNQSHPHGVLVKLNNGEIGRVKHEAQDGSQKSTIDTLSLSKTVSWKLASVNSKAIL